MRDSRQHGVELGSGSTGTTDADPAASDAHRVAADGWRAPRRFTFATGLLLAAALLYLARVTLHIGGPGHEALWNHWVYDGVIGTAALLCLLRARVGADRLAWGLCGTALCVYWLGDLYWNTYDSSLANPPYPSWADAGWLSYYLPLYAGMMVLLRRRIASLPMSTWLEGLVGGLALASVSATVVFNPVVASTRGSISTVLTNLAYPTMDVLLLALVAGGFVVLGREAGRSWILLGLGLLLAGLGDSVYLVQASSNTYLEGGWVNACWPLAFTLMALAAWSPTGAEQPEPPAEGNGLNLLSGFFAILILGLLGYSAFWSVPAVAHILLTLAVLALFARVGLAARERQQLVRVKREAATDALTGLANRGSLHKLLDRALADTRPLALLFIDLDRFLDLTNTLGRQACDSLIRQVAERLREAAPDRLMLARIGEDEFALALEASDRERSSLRVASRIRAALEDPFALDGLLVTVRASIGIALAPEQARTRAELMRCADTAMCRARSHHSGIESYSHEGKDFGMDHLLLMSELREAVEREQLLLHYQPKVALADGSLAGVEVLVRWQHPRLGLLGPDRFVPIVEREGMMRELTMFVLERTLRQQRAWLAEGLLVPVAVNLSPTNLIDVRLPSDVRELVRRHQTPAGMLELEITEETLMRDAGRALDMMARVGELGVEFSLDDFGTGYSSLEQLRRLPVRTLKIDRSFVMGMDDSPEDAAIVESIVGLAHSLKLRVVAEGVESARHLQKLTAMGCDIAQGFHLARPMPATALARWINELRPGPAPAPAPRRHGRVAP